MLVVLSLKCSYIWECPQVLPVGVKIQLKPMRVLCTFSNCWLRQDGMLAASKNYSKFLLRCLTQHVPHREAGLCHQCHVALLQLIHILALKPIVGCLSYAGLIGE